MNQGDSSALFKWSSSMLKSTHKLWDRACSERVSGEKEMRRERAPRRV